MRKAMTATDSLPPEGVLVPFAKCQGCGMVSTRLSVVTKHQETRCAGAGITKMKKWMVEKAGARPDEQQPQALPTGAQANVTNVVININVFPPNTVPVDQEAIVEYLKQNIDLLEGLLAPPRYKTMPARASDADRVRRGSRRGGVGGGAAAC